jgi:hypothetical protein
LDQKIVNSVIRANRGNIIKFFIDATVLIQLDDSVTLNGIKSTECSAKYYNTIIINYDSFDCIICSICWSSTNKSPIKKTAFCCI